MIVTKYPEWVEAQLKILDERIEEMYREYMDVKLKPDDAMRIKRNLAERIKPFVDEKVRLISNSYPTYILDKAPRTESEDKISDEPFDSEELEQLAEYFGRRFNDPLLKEYMDILNKLQAESKGQGC